MSTDHEPVYDSEIAPLMSKIIEICKRDNIPFVASFYLNSQDGDPFICTSCLTTSTETPESFKDVVRILRSGYKAVPPSTIAMTIVSKDPNKGV